MKLLALMMVGLCTVAAAQPAPKKAAAPAPKKKDAAPVDPYAEPKKAPAGPQDPYAQTASPNDAPGVPARVGLSDLTAVQGLLAVQRLDGWLLYDRDGSNPIAVRLVSPDGHPQRAWFYMIPARGEPVALVHVSERSLFDKLPGKKLTYLGYRDLGKQVAQLLKGVKSIAIEYSAKAAVPNISRVDAGTVELIRAAGVAVRSSDTLVGVERLEGCAQGVGSGDEQITDLVRDPGPSVSGRAERHPQRPDRLDDPIGGLGDRGGFAVEHRSGSGLGVNGVTLAPPPPELAVRPVDLDHLDPASGQGPGQAQAVAAGALDPDLDEGAMALQPPLEPAIARCSRWELLSTQDPTDVIDDRGNVELLVGVDTAIDGALWFDHA